MSDTDSLVRERFLRRRLAALDATPWFHGAAATSTHIMEQLERLRTFEHAIAGGDDGAWHLFAAHDPAPWFGGPTTIVFADRARGDGRALEGLAAAWSEAGLHRREDVWLEVDPRDSALLDLLLRDSMGVDSFITTGGVGEAFAALSQCGLAAGATPWALEMLEAGDIDAVVSLHATTFSSNPEWCWFGAAPAHLDTLRQTLTDWVGDGTPTHGHWVFRDALGRPAGHVEVSISEDPVLGRSAGVGIVLSPPLRGQGLLRVAWQRCLVIAREAGARVWKGGTSQPAVLSLGARMGRRVHQIGFRRGRDRERSETLLALARAVGLMPTP